MQDVYKNTEEYNPGQKFYVLRVFDEIIANIISNKKLNQVVTEPLARRRKLNISSVLTHKVVSNTWRC